MCDFHAYRGLSMRCERHNKNATTMQKREKLVALCRVQDALFEHIGSNGIYKLICNDTKKPILL